MNCSSFRIIRKIWRFWGKAASLIVLSVEKFWQRKEGERSRDGWMSEWGIGKIIIMWREQFFASGDAFRSENRPLPACNLQKPEEGRFLLLSCNMKLTRYRTSEINPPGYNGSARNLCKYYTQSWRRGLSRLESNTSKRSCQCHKGKISITIYKEFFDKLSQYHSCIGKSLALIMMFWWRSEGEVRIILSSALTERLSWFC